MELYKGDCLKLMADIPDKSIDMVLCDLPFGITRNEWDKKLPFNELWKAYRRLIKDNGAIVLFACQPFTSELVLSNKDMFRYELIWDKGLGTDFLNCRRKPMRSHENILIFANGQTTYNPQKWQSKPYKRTSSDKNSSNWGKIMECRGSSSANGLRYPLSIVKLSQRRVKHMHPTQKPTDLLEWLIKSYTNQGDTVLDNCMGSGSTGIACINTKRNFIGMEINDEYFNMAVQRIKDAEKEKLEVKAI